MPVRGVTGSGTVKHTTLAPTPIPVKGPAYPVEVDRHPGKYRQHRISSMSSGRLSNTEEIGPASSWHPVKAPRLRTTSRPRVAFAVSGIVVEYRVMFAFAAKVPVTTCVSLPVHVSLLAGGVYAVHVTFALAAVVARYTDSA